MPKLKKELEAENKQLREIAQKLKDELEEEKKKTIPGVEGSELPLRGMSIYQTGKRFKMVQLAFHPVTKEARVVDITRIQPTDQDYDLAVMMGKKELVEKIVHQPFEEETNE